MTLDPSIDGMNSPSSGYVDRRLVAASGLLLTGGLLVCLTGAAAGTYAAVSAVRRYVADREERPGETLRRRWGQVRSAGVAGVGAWQDFNRQARPASAMGRATVGLD
jgi:hypothetical protein